MNLKFKSWVVGGVDKVENYYVKIYLESFANLWWDNEERQFSLKYFSLKDKHCDDQYGYHFFKR